MKNLVLTFAFLCSILIAQSQTIQGDISAFSILKNTSKVNVVFDFSTFRVGKALSDSEYVEKKVNAYNEKEPGRGDEWKEKWTNDREARFEPQFLELLNKYVKGKIDFSKNAADTKYTLIVKTTFVEPGFNVGVARKNAYVNLAITIVDSQNIKVGLATIKLVKSPGRGGYGSDFDTGYRIEQAYAKAGKTLGKAMMDSKLL